MERFHPVVLIPAYREAATIRTVVAAAAAYAPVIVADDCSPDTTADEAMRGGAAVICNSANLGYEATLNRLFDEAVARGYSHAVTMDADGEHDPALVPSFLTALGRDGISLVLGVRPRKQRISEVVMGRYIARRFGVRDILCGMKGYDLALVERNGGFDTSASIGTELALNSIRRGAAFTQIDVSGTPRHDAPRFDRRINANLRIFKALLRAVRLDGREPLRSRLP